MWEAATNIEYERMTEGILALESPLYTHACGSRDRGSGSLAEERAHRMSPNYDSNMNNGYNSLIHSEVHMTLKVTISNVGHVNCHSRSHRHFQHRTARVLFHTHPNRNTSMT